MRIRQIDFPRGLLEARKSGRLVVFAGAGVSMDPPSNYPDFKALADRVGGDQNPRLSHNEMTDVYLGRLEATGITVHDQVQTILSSPDSVHNTNHSAIVRIFKDQKSFRLVTTNFDRHFFTAAKDRFGETTFEVFNAPALPIGSDFTGIVNLHGSVDRDPHRMVLTDRDFGRAYITEGWATRFLERLFSRFVVLFVGYSHEDILLSYFARGLTGSPGAERFALTPPNKDSRWESLGITPIHYPPAAPSSPKHSQLTTGLAGWAEQCQETPLITEERIRKIVTQEGVPAPDSEEDDYVKNALLEITTVRFFIRHCRGLHWLKWAESQPAFQRVFVNRPDYSEIEQVLAGWFVGEFAIQHLDAALNVICRQNQGISSLLWHEIALMLFRGKIHGESLSKWVVLLVTNPPLSRGIEVIEYVLSHCLYPEDEVSALLLFEYLTRPQIHLKKSFRLSANGGEREASVEIEVKCSGSEYWLRQAWNNIFESNLDALARRVTSIVSSHLITARRLLGGFKENLTFDFLSFSRGMIESREQDHLRSGFSVLLDAGAAAIKWAAERDTDWANALISDWFPSDSMILQRLAIFGTAISSHIPADEKLKWIYQNDLIYKTGVKHEVFLVLKNAYPRASPEARRQFLIEAENQNKPDPENPDFAAYRLFNLIVWLSKSDPSCQLALDLLARLKETNPAFAEREHPDMDSWIGSSKLAGWESPIVSIDLSACQLEQILEKLKTLPSNFYPGTHSKEGFINQITQYAQTSHEWGISIAREANNKAVWLPEIWQALLGAWAGTQLTEQEWTTVLDILQASTPIYKSALHSMTWLLERGIRNDSAPIAPKLIYRAKELADQLWTHIESEDVEQITGEIDWLGRAINHPAGILFQFYFHSLVVLQREKLIPEHSLESYKPVFTLALTGLTRAAQLARVVLASQLYLLFHVERDWTVKNVFPILDPKLDLERAKQCWHGFLYWGSWTNSMLVDLMGCYEGMFPFIDHEKNEIRRMFCGHMSGIAIHSYLHPLENGWLFRFLATIKPDTRSQWADEFRSGIGALGDEAKLRVWESWLRNYWEERLQGRPMPLNAKESAEMLEWLIDLGPMFPEAVNLIRRGPAPELGNSMAYYRLSKSELLKEYPDAFADLLAFMTSKEGSRPIYDLSELYSAVEQLVKIIPQNLCLRGLCDELVRLGISNVASLAAKLDPPYTL